MYLSALMWLSAVSVWVLQIPSVKSLKFFLAMLADETILVLLPEVGAAWFSVGLLSAFMLSLYLAGILKACFQPAAPSWGTVLPVSSTCWCLLLHWFLSVLLPLRFLPSSHSQYWECCLILVTSNVSWLYLKKISSSFCFLSCQGGNPSKCLWSYFTVTLPVNSSLP